MSAGRLFYNDRLVDLSATATASSEASEYPVENVFTNNYSQVWRSDAADSSGETIVFDFGLSVDVNDIAIGNTNIRSTATVKIQGNNANSWGAPTIDETIDVTSMDGTRRCIYHNFDGSGLRYWRLVVIDDGNPDGFIEIGKVMLGDAVTLSDNYDATFTRRRLRNNVIHRTEYNQAFVYNRDYGAAFALSWTNCQEETRDQIRALELALNGNGRPFFFVLDPTDPAEAFWVRMEGDIEEGRVSFDVFVIRMNLIEEMPGQIVPR